MSKFDQVNKVLRASSLNASTLLSLVGKVAPKIAPFISGAAGAGYAADQVLDFLRNKFANPAEKRERERLEARAQSGTARSDELAHLSQKEQAGQLGNILGGAGRLGSQIAGGLGTLGASNANAEQEQQRAQQMEVQAQEAQAAKQAQYEQEQASKQAQYQQRLASQEEQRNYTRERYAKQDERRAAERAENEARRVAKENTKASIPDRKEFEKMESIADSILKSGIKESDIPSALAGLRFAPAQIKQFMDQKFGSKNQQKSAGVNPNIKALADFAASLEKSLGK